MDGLAALPLGEIDGLAVPAEPEAGSVWLVAAGEGALSTLALQGLAAADAVIYDVSVAPAVLRLVRPGCLAQRAWPDRGDGFATRRCIALARDGWRVVRLIGSGAGAQDEEARAVTAAGIPVRILAGAGLLPRRLGGAARAAADMTAFTMAGLAG